MRPFFPFRILDAFGPMFARVKAVRVLMWPGARPCALVGRPLPAPGLARGYRVRHRYQAARSAIRPPNTTGPR
jgi:hypothetical protein